RAHFATNRRSSFGHAGRAIAKDSARQSRIDFGFGQSEGQRLMKNLVRVLLCLSLGVVAVTRAVSSSKNPDATAEKKTTNQKADAKTLLLDAKKATAALIKNARADKDLDPKKPKNKPFWQSLHLIAKSLETAETGLAAKNDDFFKGIADARKA